MKVGGNQSATDFFTKRGGAALLTDSDTKKKYTSQIAPLYKEELARRVKEDISLYVYSHPTLTFMTFLVSSLAGTAILTSQSRSDHVLDL